SPRRTVPAARTRRRSLHCSRADCRSPTRPARQPGSRGTLSPTGSRSLAGVTVRSMSSTSMRLAELGELGLLKELERRGLARGIADDAACLADGLVVTQDVLVEGVHFRRDWISWRELGFRAAAVNLSDLAASGAEPEAL